MNMYAAIDTPIQYVKGVGPKLSDYLGRKGLRTVLDLLEYYPRAYEDRRQARDIRSLVDGETVGLKAKIVKVSHIPLGTRRKIYDVLLMDGSGSIHCKYFRIPFRGYFERFKPGMEVKVVGKVINYRGKIEFHHPDIYEFNKDEEESLDALVPIYVETEGLTSRKISRFVKAAIESLKTSKVAVPETLPKWLRDEYDLKGRFESFEKIHGPPHDSGVDYSQLKTPYHYRIKFEEFFWLELLLARSHEKLKTHAAIAVESKKVLSGKILANLPFSLTSDQTLAIGEILKDLSNPYPMHRLLQGDVGSGKTVVAFLTAAEVIENGHQAAVMVPTEILAEQHYKVANKIFSPHGIKVELLTSKSSSRDPKEILEDLKSGKINLVIGTQALIQEKVEFKSLAYAVVDEQHRFGVEQRQELKNKGISPHLLLMTATPIPRSLALTVYGDLEVSIIREKPPGRMPIQTRVVFQNKRQQVLDFMAEQIGKGRQAYFIFPLVEESEKIDLKDAVREYEKLVIEFPKIKFGLLHGKMNSEEKDEVMQKFRKNEVHVLVSTTVIEVGVDVPNANMIVVEHAERFGLSQLHQLRGRVGRGSLKSFCILLMGNAVSNESRERVMWLEKTNDGFELAEADLKIRGPGEFVGTRQSGALGFKMADLVVDIEILKKARQAAKEVISRDPELKRPEHLTLRETLEDRQRVFIG